MSKLVLSALPERVAPMQAADTKIVQVFAIIVIGVIVVETGTGGPPNNFGCD